MNKNYVTIDEYLNEVKMYLEPLPDRDQIINELRAHLWDLANKISREKGLSAQEAFNQAIGLMEDPQTLANKFLEEEPRDLKVDWKAPIKVPIPLPPANFKNKDQLWPVTAATPAKI